MLLLGAYLALGKVQAQAQPQAQPQASFPTAPSVTNPAGNEARDSKAGLTIGLTITDQLVLRKVITPGAVFATADKASGKTESEVVLEGNAMVRRDGSVISAERLTYYPKDDVLTGAGSVRVSKDATVLVGTELSLKLDTQEGFMNKTSYAIGSLGGRGFAEKLSS